MKKFLFFIIAFAFLIHLFFVTKVLAAFDSVSLNARDGVFVDELFTLEAYWQGLCSDPPDQSSFTDFPCTLKSVGSRDEEDLDGGLCSISQKMNVQCLSAGDKYFNVTIKQNGVVTANGSKNIFAETNNTPLASALTADKTTVKIGEQIIFYPSGDSKNDERVDYIDRWTLQYNSDGNMVVIDDRWPKTNTFYAESKYSSFSKVGNYIIYLSITDRGGLTDGNDNILTITVEANKAPVADFSASPTVGMEPLKVNFSDLSSDSDGSIQNWSWDFDNDGVGDNFTQNPIITYGSSGKYSVRLKVFDNQGAEDTKIKTDYITVTPPPSLTCDDCKAGNSSCDQISSGACCYGLTRRSCNTANSCQYNLCSTDCAGNNPESFLGPNLECNGKAYDSVWVEGDTCYYCSQAGSPSCSYGADTKKPRDYYNNNGYYRIYPDGSIGSAEGTCYYDCEIVCEAGGWKRQNCGTAKKTPSVNTDGYGTHYVCTSDRPGYLPSSSGQKPSIPNPTIDDDTCYSYGAVLRNNNQEGAGDVGGWSLETYSDSNKPACPDGKSPNCTNSGWRCPSPAPPTPPTGFTGIGASPSSIQWSWNSSSGATYYQVWDSCTSVKKDNITSTSWTEGFSTCVTVERAVKACNNNGCSSCSSFDTASTLAMIPDQPFSQVLGLTGIKWWWNPTFCGTKDYYLYNLVTGANSGWIAGTEWSEGGLICGTGYYQAKVKARNFDNIETDYSYSSSPEVIPCCDSDGTACSADSGCCSGNCVLDYDGSPKICAPANQCQHNGIINTYFINTDYPALGQYCSDCTGNTARWISNSGRFIIRQKTDGAKRMVLDKNGQLLLFDTRQSAWADPVSGAGNWLVRLSGVVKAWLGLAGNLYLRGSLSTEQATIGSAGPALFFREKAGQTYVGKIDSSGNMYIKGQLGEGCSLP